MGSEYVLIGWDNMCRLSVVGCVCVCRVCTFEIAKMRHDL